MFEIRNLSKTFGGLQKVLNRVDITIEKGEVIAVLGPSGSGKTTLLRCMSFLEKADTGTMVFDSKEYDLPTAGKKDIADIRKKMGFVFQSFNLFSNMTVLENVMEGLVTAQKIDKKEAAKTAEETLARVDMADKAGCYPDQLSGGQQQRAAIARALALNPEVILFDEPTSALDPERTVEVLQTMKKLASEGMTMLVVTHELAFARHVADRVIFMKDGYIAEDSESGEFFRCPKSEHSLKFINMLSPEHILR